MPELEYPKGSNNEWSKVIGDYYRDLSLNYHDYLHGAMYWPYRPDNIPRWVINEDYAFA